MSRGQADGFELDILTKLKDVKSKDHTFTLMHYLVQVYLDMYDKVPLANYREIQWIRHTRDSTLNFMRKRILHII